MQKLWGFEFAFGSTPELVRSFRPHRSLRSQMTGVSGPSFSLSFVSAVVRFCIGVRSSPGEGPESPARGPGISGPPFSRLLCICVVRLWIGVRSSPGGCPESPAWPESPAPRTGISGLPDDPAGRSLRSLTPESPAWTGSNG